MTERGDESIFLLDDRGCPTNLNIFPPLDKVLTNSSKKLVATFEAFKFASSPVVRFSVIVQFCSSKCLPVSIVTYKYIPCNRTLFLLRSSVTIILNHLEEENVK